MGVGRIRLVDRDVVEISNLQRQHLYGVDKVGYPKVEAAAERLRRLNPFIEVEPVPMSLNLSNAEKIIEGSDVVLDCLDSMSARYALNRACVKLGIPMVHGAVITNIGNVTTIIPHETVCLECFKGNLNDEDLPSCAVVGVNPSIISVIASIQVSEAVKLLLGRTPNLTNKLLFCDIEDLSFEKIQLARVENCPICSETPSLQPYAIRHEKIQEICGREGRRVFVFSPDENLDINLGVLNKKLENLGYKLNVQASLGTTFSRGKIKGSILKSGVSILEGMQNKEEAETLHFDILGDLT
jgi:adenylyltransferase/sulfurtransferase